jgi:hypothetical protein
MGVVSTSLNTLPASAKISSRILHYHRKMITWLNSQKDETISSCSLLMDHGISTGIALVNLTISTGLSGQGPSTLEQQSPRRLRAPLKSSVQNVSALNCALARREKDM